MEVAGSVVEVEVDIAAGGLGVDPEEEGVAEVLAFWAGPITCNDLVFYVSVKRTRARCNLDKIRSQWSRVRHDNCVYYLDKI